MSPHPPLLTRLRRMLGVRWLFALLLVAKLAMGTACLAVDAGSGEDAAAVKTVLVSGGEANGQDDASGACWHGDAGGCHCNCTHATPLFGAVSAAVPRQSPGHDFPAAQPGLLSIPARNPLRPPIA